MAAKSRWTGHLWQKRQSISHTKDLADERIDGFITGSLLHQFGSIHRKCRSRHRAYVLRCNLYRCVCQFLYCDSKSWDSSWIFLWNPKTSRRKSVSVWKWLILNETHRVIESFQKCFKLQEMRIERTVTTQTRRRSYINLPKYSLSWHLVAPLCMVSVRFWWSFTIWLPTVIQSDPGVCITITFGIFSKEQFKFS